MIKYEKMGQRNACKLTLFTKRETKKVNFAKLETSMQTCKIIANQLTRLKILQNL